MLTTLKILFRAILFLFLLQNFVLLTVPPNKVAVLVVSCPRSGTSCMTGVLKILGVDLGENLKDPKTQGGFNIKGDFEDTITIKVAQPIVLELESHPFFPRFIDWKNVSPSQKQKLKNKIKEYMKENFGSFSIFGIKWPPISLLLPLYLEAIQELGYAPKIIVMLRNPAEVATSWNKRWGHAKEKIYESISQYLVHILRDTQGHDTLVIQFDDLLNKTEETVEKLKMFIPELKSYQEVKQKLDQFLDKDLKHS